MVRMLAATLLCLPGCVGSGVSGTYVFEEDGEQLALELKEGGGAVLALSERGGKALLSSQGKYTVEGDQITTVFDSTVTQLTWKDGTVTTNFYGEKVVLKKR
jgi:hypothetical protein